MAAKDSLVLLLIGSCFLPACGERTADPGKSTPPKPSAGVSTPPPAPVPELVDPRLDQAIQLVGTRKYPAARSILEKLFAEHPEAARVSFFLALTYHKEGRYELARRHYEAIIPRGPIFEDYYKAQYFYGWCLYNLGDVKKARVIFDVFLAKEPGSSDANFALGLIELDAGHLDEAEKRFQKSISLAGGKASSIAKARTRLADVYVQQNRLKEAKKELEQAIALRPQQYNAYYKLYQVELERGEEEKAREALAQFEAWKARAGR